MPITTTLSLFVLGGKSLLSAAPSVSVIIPTSRPKAFLKDILSIRSERASSLEFIVIIDNPNTHLAALIQEIIDQQALIAKIRIFQNERVLGAPVSRNRGIREASGELLIFLDDDVIPDADLIDAYIENLASLPYKGALGVTNIPFDQNSILERAIKKVGFTYAYSMANHYNFHSWGPTCNLAIVKSKQEKKNVFFDPIFPKSGGGEDVDFCWRLGGKDQKSLISVVRAVTCHPPWKGLQNNLQRFFRWGIADVPLNDRHPDRRFRDFPNFVEFHIAIFLISLGWSIWHADVTLLPFLTTLLLMSFILVGLSESYSLRTDPLTAMMGLLLVVIHDLGRFIGLLQHKKLLQIFARTLYFDGDIPWRTRKRALLNLGTMILALILNMVIWTTFLKQN